MALIEVFSMFLEELRKTSVSTFNKNPHETSVFSIKRDVSFKKPLGYFLTFSKPQRNFKMKILKLNYAERSNESIKASSYIEP